MTTTVITVEALEKAAKEHTGLSDFGDDYYRAGLCKLIESLKADGPLHEAGQSAMFDLLVVRLAARLKLECLLKQKPEIGAWNNEHPPIFVVGTIRSGTTLLYNLLALDERARSPQLWETLDPIPPASLSTEEEVNARISAMEQLLKTYNENAPQLAKIHHFNSATQVEECNGLHEHTFASPSIAYFLWGGATYYEWLARQPEDSLVTVYRDFLRMVSVLMHGHEGKYWLAKCPLYAPHVTEIATVFPNARFVHSHRDARERIPSSCSLLQNFQAVYCNPLPENVARQVLFYNDKAMEGIERGRQSRNGSRSVDVDYAELIAAPVETVEKLYESLGMSVTDAHRKAMMDWACTRNPYDPKRVGRHQYDLTQFGLSERKLAKMAP